MSLEGKHALFMYYTGRSTLFELPLLQLLGMEVRGALTPEDLIKTANQYGCDLVVISVDDLSFFRDEAEYGISDLCGIVALVRAARDHLAQVPFLLIGRNTPTADEAASMKAANIVYFQSPVRREVFNATVEALLK